MPEAFPSQNIARSTYYDRRATPTASTYNAGGVAPHALTVRWAYTVPAGRRAFVETAYVMVMRDTAAAAALDAQGFVSYTPSGGALAHLTRVINRNNTAGTIQKETLGAVSYMAEGDLLEGYTYDDSTGGSCTFNVTSKRTEFDA